MGQNPILVNEGCKIRTSYDTLSTLHENQCIFIHFDTENKFQRGRIPYGEIASKKRKCETRSKQRALYI